MSLIGEYQIRPEKLDDHHAIHALLNRAFPSPAEAELVDKLRTQGDLTLALLATSGSRIVGVVCLSPVSHPELTHGFGLGPIAVEPELQGLGIGSLLMEAIETQSKDLGARWIVLLGDPQYYRRFGYQTASSFGLENEYGADEAFMALELTQGALDCPGLVLYSSAFRELG